MLASSSSVRGHHAIFKPPQRALGRQRLNRGDVKRRSANNAFFEGFLETRAVNDLAPSDI